MTRKKQIKLLKELIERDRKKKRTKEEAMQTLISAGIFDENGNYTEPYKALESITIRHKQPHV